VPVAFQREAAEGSAIWLCGLVKMKDAPGSEDKAYDYVNAFLDPSSTVPLKEAGYGQANAAAMRQFTPEDLASVGMGDIDAPILAQLPMDGRCATGRRPSSSGSRRASEPRPFRRAPRARRMPSDLSELDADAAGAREHRLAHVVGHLDAARARPGGIHPHELRDDAPRIVEIAHRHRDAVRPLASGVGTR
jgi:hypothetical protein